MCALREIFSYNKYNGRIRARGEKTRVLDSSRTSGKEVKAIRQAWASLTNESLERAGHSERIDPRSLATQGIARMPSVHLGPIATAMEQRSIQTERVDQRRA
ncbi:MobA/MobL family protein [Desulfovibrio piger]|nr:MobA/MobL family protein [Desulfovibrio piger]